MDKRVLDELTASLRQLSSTEPNDKLVIAGNEISLDKDNIKSITKTDSSESITFIDGGNADLFVTSNFVLSFIRVAATTFENNQRKQTFKREFFTIISATDHGLVASFVGETKQPLAFSVDDIKDASNLVRRVSELEFASEHIKSDYVVLDGDFTTKHELEREYLQKLSELTNHSGNGLAALAKTSGLLTKSNKSASSALHYTFAECSGFLELDAIEPKTHFAKLHKKSNYCFKIETLNIKDSQKIMSLLKQNSTDPTFLGYPYGLVLVDKLARVTNNEVDYLKTTLNAALGKDAENLDNNLSSLNAHSVLDRLG
jgi:hypothetical protein